MKKVTYGAILLLIMGTWGVSSFAAGQSAGSGSRGSAGKTFGRGIGKPSGKPAAKPAKPASPVVAPAPAVNPCAGKNIGDEAGDGIIIFNDANTCKVISKTEDNLPWGCRDKSIPGAKDFNNGAANTKAIVAGCDEDNIAAKYCNNMSPKGEWYLVAESESKEILKNWAILNSKGANLSPSNNYWSSVEHKDYSFSARLYSYNGSIEKSNSFELTAADGKQHKRSVRCVRAFKN